MNKTDNDNCIVCGKSLANNHQQIHQKVRGDAEGNHRVIKCNSCGHIQLFPAYYDFKSHYEADSQNNELMDSLGVSFADIIEKEAVEAERRYEFISKNILDMSAKSLLDVGGGYCTFANYCKKHEPSVKIKVVEPSRHRSDKGKKYHHIENLEVDSQFVDGSYAQQNSEKYDIVTLWHVLEHVYNVRELLSNLYKMVKQGGYLLMEVPNGADELSGIEDYGNIIYMVHHLSYFTEDVLKRIFEDVGIKNYKIKYIQRYGFNNYINWVYNKFRNFNLRNEMFSGGENLHWLERAWIEGKKKQKNTDTLFIIIQK